MKPNLLIKQSLLFLSLALIYPTSVTALVWQLERLWAFPTREDTHFTFRPIERTKPIIVGQVLYLANQAGKVMALEKYKAIPLWETQLPYPISGFLGYGRSLLFVGDRQGYIRALRVRNKEQIWQYHLAGEWLSPPILIQNILIATNHQGIVIALKARSGKELWRYQHLASSGMSIRGNSPPVSYGQTIYQGFEDGTVVALNALSGKLLWQKELSPNTEQLADIDAKAAVDENALYVANYQGKIYRLNRLTGEIEWTFYKGAWSGIRLENDQIFFSSTDGYLYCLDRSKGYLKWKFLFGKALIASEPILWKNQVIIIDVLGNLFGLDKKTGKLLYQYKTYLPSLGTITWDEESERIFGLSRFGQAFSLRLSPTRFVRRKKIKKIHPLTALYTPQNYSHD